MSYGTLDRNPPPFFRQGTSALTQLVLCAAFAVFLMVLDARFKLAMPARAGLALVLYPVQRVLLVPVEVTAGMKYGPMRQRFAIFIALSRIAGV